jgi:hypothetical protein
MTTRRALSRPLGFSVLEMVITLGITTVVLVCLTGFLILGMRAWAVGGTQGTVDRDASYAVRRIIRDVREAEIVEVGGPDHAYVRYPQRDADNDYVRGTLDTVYWVEYYSGTADGTPSAGGAYLWRAVSGTPESAVARDLTQLAFESGGLDSVRVTVTLSRSNTFGVFTCSHTSRVIKLRNW